MNRKRFPIPLTVACMLVLGCVSCSQTPGGHQQQAPAPGATAPAPSRTAGEPMPPQSGGVTAPSAAGNPDGLAGGRGSM